MLEWASPPAPLRPSRPHGPQGPIVPVAGSVAMVPTADCAVQVLSNALASMPLRPWQRSVSSAGIDVFEPAEIDRLTPLLEQPFELLDPYAFWHLVYRQLTATSNCFLVKIMDAAGRVAQLVPALYAGGLHTGRWRHGFLRVRRDLTLSWGGQQQVKAQLPQAAYIHLHGAELDFNTMLAPSPVQRAAAKEVMKALAGALKYQSATMGEGYRSSVGIELDAMLADGLDLNAIQDLRDEIEFLYSELNTAGSPSVLPPGAKFSTMGRVSPTDLQVIDLLRWGVEEIARVFNVPPRKLYHYEQGQRVANNAPQQQAASDFYRQSLRPPMDAISSVFTHGLLTPEERGRNLVLRQDPRMATAGTFTEQVEAAVQAYAHGGLVDLDTARSLLELAEAPPGEGKKFQTPVGGTPASRTNREDGTDG